MATAPIDPDIIAAMQFDQVITGTGGWDTLVGSAGRDHILGGNGSDVLFGHGEADLLEGGNGDDRMNGGAGDDVLLGGTGSDVLEGGAGTNVLEGGAGNDTYVLAYGTDSVFDSDGLDDRLVTTTDIDLNDYVGSGIEHFVITPVHPSRLGVVATGTDGDDSISGSGAGVVFDAGDGNDVLRGADGSNEVYIGGLGRDIMDSGVKDLGPPHWGQHSGVDRFDFVTVADSTAGADRDVILNFLSGGGAGGDLIHLGLIDANTARTGNQAFTFVGEADFTGAAGELRAAPLAGSTDRQIVSGDVDGDAVADFEIEVQMQVLTTPLSVFDFIL